MSQDNMQYFKQKLLKEKEEMVEVVSGIKKGGLNSSLSDSIEEFSVYDQHPADVGSEVFERSKDFALRESQLSRLEAIDRALEKINNNNYGICEECGREISFERLEAIPYTGICYECKKDKEGRRSDEPTRPVEEELMQRPVESDIVFDGDDSWQTVARWQENSPEADAGAYYGPLEGVEEKTGFTEEIDNLSYEVGDDGLFYQNFTGYDDESSPSEKIDIGIEHEEHEGSD